MIYCHGFPASRLEAKLLAEVAEAQHLRLIAIDRPGFGGSDFQHGRRMPDWADDVWTVADRLAFERFAVLGVSGGAPYAVVCAQYLSARVTRLGLVCPLGRLTEFSATQGMSILARSTIGLAQSAPALARVVYLTLLAPVMRTYPHLTLKFLTGLTPPPDRAVLRDSYVSSVICAAIREAFRQGGQGAVWDMHLFTHAWELDPTAVQCDSLLWHGELDHTVPIEMGRAYASQLPGCQSTFFEHEGHFSLPVRHASKILASLKAR